MKLNPDELFQMELGMEFLDEVESVAGPYGITINRYVQANGDYWSVFGAGIHAGGYGTLDDAMTAWLDGRRFTNDN